MFDFDVVAGPTHGLRQPRPEAPAAPVPAVVPSPPVAEKEEPANARRAA